MKALCGSPTGIIREFVMRAGMRCCDQNDNSKIWGRMLKAEKRDFMQNKRLWIIPVTFVFISCLVFLIFTEQYYHADESAYTALESDETVTIVKTEYGWLFDGPSETDAFIFYPGGKVEETAYAPLLHHLAGQGMDVCLVKMPFRLAVFGAKKADQVMTRYDYTHWYIGGHSLGGVMAASYASAHSSLLRGVYMLAAYPSKSLADNNRAVIIYGSEDGVLNMVKLKERNRYLPVSSETYVIEGGNHAQFGNYGKQTGDGNATISPEEQQRRTVDFILQNK